MSIFLSCGEPSGDAYAGVLTRSLKARGYSKEIWGMGGEEAERAGCSLVRNMNSLCIMGISEVLPSLYSLVRLRNHLADMIVKRRPRAVVVIDSPDFHLSLLKRIRKKGYSGRIVYLVPPTVWAWRQKRTRVLRSLCDVCLPLFGFEHSFLLSSNVNSAWKGHPLLDEVAERPVLQAPDRRLDRENISVALLPGSRKSEINRLLPIFEALGAKLEKNGYSPVFSIAPGLPSNVKEQMRRRLEGMETFEGSGRELISRTSASVAASGTVSVEALLFDRFMVVAYRTSLLTSLVYRALVRTDFVSIPNVIAREEIYPEFLQKEATSTNLSAELFRYFENEEGRKEIHRKLALVRADLGERGAGDFWAKTVLELIGE